MTERFTVSVEPQLSEAFDGFMRRKGYGNRSEAVRDLIRGALAREILAPEQEGSCVAVLSYMYDHHERELSKRLTQTHHAHFDLTVTTLHMHLDHDHCVEAVLLKGLARDVQAFAESVMARPGIRHGTLHRMPMPLGPGGAEMACEVEEGCLGAGEPEGMSTHVKHGHGQGRD
jgi:CopG family nickel-responsive transcriptional regulator